MIKFLRWYKSYLHCTLRGGDMERFFNMCKNHGIELWGIDLNSNQCMCFMYVDDFWHVRKFIKKSKVKIHINQKYGFRFVLKKLYNQKIFYGGCLCFLCMLCFLASHIWQFEIYGNSYYTKSSILKHLKMNENIHIGSNKKDIHLKSVEESVRKCFPEISWISSYIKGTSLIIEIEEDVHEDNIQNIVKTERICSNVDGEVVAMVTRSGTPVVSVGDWVEIGDELINGKINIHDDAMNIIEERLVGADGDVWIKTVENYHKEYPYTIKSKQYQKSNYDLRFMFGNGKTNLYIKFPKTDLTLPAFHVTDYIFQADTCSLSLEIRIPYESISALKSSSDAKKAAEKELSDLFSKFNEKGVQIIQNNVKMILYGDHLEAVGSLVILHPISTLKTSLLNPPENIENGETYEYNGNDN